MKTFNEKLLTTHVVDALGSKYYMNNKIKPLKKGWRFWGEAITVDISEGENISVLEAILIAKPGDVLVIDGKSGERNAFAGDFIISLAKNKGIVGIVSNGVVRDIDGIEEVDLPVFCTGVTTAASKKHEVGRINLPVTVGGVIVKPHDIVFGDNNGVVVIPKEKAAETIHEAERILEKDTKREAEVNDSVEKTDKYIHDFLKKYK